MRKILKRNRVHVMNYLLFERTEDNCKTKCPYEINIFFQFGDQDFL